MSDMEEMNTIFILKFVHRQNQILLKTAFNNVIYAQNKPIKENM
jgi:hypothetical protein